MARPRNDGSKLEQQVAEWLRRRGYSARTNQHVRGEEAVRPYEVDVQATLRDRRWQRILLAALATVAVAVFISFSSAPEARQAATAINQTAASFSPGLAGSGVFLLGTVAAIVALIGLQRSTRRVWVECKDLKVRVKREHVNKLQGSVSDVRKLRSDGLGSKWKPTSVMLVSRSGFDQDAIAVARANKIECYEADAAGALTRVD